MEKLISEIMSFWFNLNPSALSALYLLFALIVWKGIPWLYNKYNRWKTDAAAKEEAFKTANEEAKQESRRLIKEISDVVSVLQDKQDESNEHLAVINGSIQKHHADNIIHIPCDRLVLKEDCRSYHTEMAEKLDDKLDSFAKELFTKYDALSKDVYLAIGRGRDAAI